MATALQVQEGLCMGQDFYLWCTRMNWHFMSHLLLQQFHCLQEEVLLRRASCLGVLLSPNKILRRPMSNWRAGAAAGRGGAGPAADAAQAEGPGDAK